MPFYTIREIGIFPGGTFSLPTAINNKGEVTGFADLPSGDDHAFFWNPNSGLQDLGTLGGKQSVGRGINDLSQVVGEADIIAGRSHAFVWSPGNVLKDLDGDGDYSVAWDINNLGDIVGYKTFDSFLSHAAIWKGMQPAQDLGTLGGPNSRAVSINDSGIITGDSQLSFTDTHLRNAFLLNGPGALQPLGNLNNQPTKGWCISNNGHIVGTAYVNSYTHKGFLWTANYGMYDIGTLGGADCTPYAVNTNGVIVGMSMNAQGNSRAFVREFGWLLDLNNMLDYGTGWVLLWANDINDHGQICGYGMHQGKMRGFILTPVHSSGQKIIAMVTNILVGGVAGNGGWVWPHGVGGPIPEPPPVVWHELSPQTQDLMISFAINEMAGRIQNHKLREKIQKVAIEIIKREIKNIS